MSLNDWNLGEQLSYQGKKDCQDPRCTRRPDVDGCFGWHCANCGQPASYQGHYGRRKDGELGFTCDGAPVPPPEPAEDEALEGTL